VQVKLFTGGHSASHHDARLGFGARCVLDRFLAGPVLARAVRIAARQRK
jgi:hypothetical protein